MGTMSLARNIQHIRRSCCSVLLRTYSSASSTGNLHQCRYGYPQRQLLLSQVFQTNSHASWNFNVSSRTFWSRSSNETLEPLSNQPYVHPHKGRLVYAGEVRRFMRNIKLFTLFTSANILALQPFIMFDPQMSNVVKASVGLVAVGFFGLCTPLLIHSVTRKYVTDIYFNDKTNVFTLSTYNIFLWRKEMEYTCDDVEVPSITGPFTTCKIKGKPVLIVKEQFLDLEVYAHMVGYFESLDMDEKENLKDDINVKVQQAQEEIDKRHKRKIDSEQPKNLAEERMKQD